MSASYLLNDSTLSIHKHFLLRSHHLVTHSSVFGWGDLHKLCFMPKKTFPPTDHLTLGFATEISQLF